MEDDEHDNSFPTNGMTVEENDDKRSTNSRLNVSSSSGMDDPLMAQDATVQNVVLASIVEEVEEVEEEQEKSSGDHPSSCVVSAAEMATHFDLVHHFPSEIVGSDEIIIKAEQMEEEQQELVAAALVKDEVGEETISIDGQHVMQHQQQQQQIAVVTTAGGDDPHNQGVAQQFIILTRTTEDSGAQGEASSSEVVAQRYLRVEGNDGQTYFLAVADEDGAKIISEPVKQLTPQQQVTSPKGMKSGRKRLVAGFAVTKSTTPSSSSLPSQSSLSLSQPTSSLSSSSSSYRARVASTECINQAWFTTRDDKNALHKEGHQWKQGQWTKEEVEILKANIDTYCKDHEIKDVAEVVFELSKDERKDFYRTIALGIQRPLFSVYRRVTRMYDRKNHRGKYTPAEMKNLRSLRAQHGNDWAAIGQALGRSASSVKDKCRLMKDNCNSGKWYPEEESRLAAAVHKLTGVKPSESITTGLSWANVAEHVGTRSEKQCRTKWLNYLNWKQQGGADWTREDDSILIEKVSELNVHNDSEIDWNALSKDWSSVRSPQWLRGKWWALKRHIPDYNKLGYPDLLSSMRKALSWSLKPKNGLGRPMKVEMKDQHAVAGASHGFLKNCIPVSITADPEGNGLSFSYCPSDDEGYQYEVLQQWSPHVITQVTQQNSAVEGGTPVVNGAPAGHIIVQAIGLPDSIQVNGQQPVIISTGGLHAQPGEDKSDANTEAAMTLNLSDNVVSQSEQEIGVLTDSDNLHDATGIAMAFDPGEGQEIITVSDYSNQPDVSGESHMLGHVFETVTSESGGDLTMGVVTFPARANSLMTGLKDPILMSSSDVECEKHPNTLTDEHTEMMG